MDEINRKASSGKPTHSSGFRKCNLLDEIVFLPAQSYPRRAVDIFRGVDIDVVFESGNMRAPLSLSSPIVVTSPPLGKISKGLKIAIASAVLRCGGLLITSENGTIDEEWKFREKGGKISITWSPDRKNISSEEFLKCDAVCIKLYSGERPGFHEIVDDSYGKRYVSPWHRDMTSDKDLSYHISLIRELTERNVPIFVRFYSSDIEKYTKLAYESGADGIIVDTHELKVFSAPRDAIKNYGISPVAAMAVVRRVLREMDVKRFPTIITTSASSGADVAKYIAMGAELVDITRACLIAAGCKQMNKCYTKKCEFKIASDDEYDWKVGAERIEKYLNALLDEIRIAVAMMGYDSIRELNIENLRALTYNAAAISGLKLEGYDDFLPMWLH